MQLILTTIVTYMERISLSLGWTLRVPLLEIPMRQERKKQMRHRQWWKWSWRGWTKCSNHHNQCNTDVNFAEGIIPLVPVFQNKISKHINHLQRQTCGVTLRKNGPIMRPQSDSIGLGSWENKGLHSSIQELETKPQCMHKKGEIKIMTNQVGGRELNYIR